MVTISYAHCKYSCIYGFKPIANHLMPVFQHISNPKKPEGVKHNATLNKIAGGMNCPDCHKSPTPLKPLNYKVHNN